MAKKIDENDFSDTPDDLEPYSEYEDIYDNKPQEKKHSARRRLDAIMEERALSKMLKDDLLDWA